MRILLTITFITLSLFSCITESEAFDLCSGADCISEHSLNSDQTEGSQDHQKHCNDSNCFGNAHFGHGQYFQSLPFSLSTSSSPVSLESSFYYSTFQSIVYPDGLFRPPLQYA